MRWLFCFIGCCFLSEIQGQRVVKKALIPPSTEFIQVDSRFCYQVELNTAQTNEVKVVAVIEGEYAQDLAVTLKEEGATMLISAGFHSNFKNPNDKLSAHKVVSIALQISVPQFKEVSIFGTQSNVEVSGNYKSLKIKLSDGNCILNNVGESVQVNTQKGNIILLASSGKVMARSSYGSVQKEEVPIGNNQYVLNTVEGSIQLKKTK